MRIKWILLNLITIVILCGCGADSANSQIASLSQTQPEFVDWNKLKEDLNPCIVHIECGEVTGSGVIGAISEDAVWILSAGHVLQHAQSCDVTFFEGEYYTGEVVYLSETNDIGLVRIGKNDSPMEESDAAALQACTLSCKEAADFLEGEEVAAYGSASYIASDFVKGYIIDPLGQVGPGALKVAQEMLVCKGAIAPGMSGSGVFDEKGQLVGIISGANEEENAYMAVPIWNIRENLTLWGF